MDSRVSHENAQFSLALSNIVFFLYTCFYNVVSQRLLCPFFSQSPWGENRHTDPAVRQAVVGEFRAGPQHRRVFSRIVLRVELQSVVVGRARFGVADEVSQSVCIEEVREQGASQVLLR